MKKIKLFLTGCAITLISSGVLAQNALHFDGTNDYVQTTYNGILGSSNRTFEAWIYVDSNAPLTNLAVLDYGFNVAGARNTFVIKGNRSIGFTSGGTNANITSTATGLIQDNQWTHVAFVLNNGTGFLYVNGSQVGTGNLSNVNTPSGNENLKIGQRVAGGNIPFYGKIDEVRIWDVARTAQEITANMNTEICGNPTGLVAYYKLNEGVAGGNNSAITTALDYSGSSNNGSLSGFTLTGTNSNWATGLGLVVGVSSSQIINECDGYAITVGNNTYTSTGIYQDTLTAASFNGCDSIITTDLTVNNPIDVTTSNTGDSITANTSGAIYQWINCGNNYAYIAGETGQSYNVTTSGDYAVEITVGNCIDTSSCENIIPLTLDDMNSNRSFNFFPNPTQGIVNIDLTPFQGKVDVSVIAITGKSVFQEEYPNNNALLDLRHLSNGVYFIKVTAERENYTIQKIIKN